MSYSVISGVRWICNGPDCPQKKDVIGTGYPRGWTSLRYYVPQVQGFAWQEVLRDYCPECKAHAVLPFGARLSDY